MATSHIIADATSFDNIVTNTTSFDPNDWKENTLLEDEAALSPPSLNQNIFRPFNAEVEQGDKKRNISSNPILTAPSSASSGNFLKGEGEHKISVLRANLDDVEKATAKATKQKEGSWDQKQFEYLLTISCLAIFSVLGVSLRVFVGNVFGGQCTNSSSWIYSFSNALNLCITSNDGALFSDLPANMLGSFIMGLLQPCQDIGLLNGAQIAFLDSRHWFQKWTVTHVGLRTGFCGSLTTFSSWNTQMVRLMDGTSTGDGSYFVAALFGYVLGLEAALASLVLGQNVAVWIHRHVNQHLAKAEDNVLSFQRKPLRRSLMTNELLPDFERRYLDSLLSEEEEAWAKKNPSLLVDLGRWKNSTAELRNTNKKSSENFTLIMYEIEHRVLIAGEEPSDILLSIADAMCWDVDALQRWATCNSSILSEAFETLSANVYSSKQRFAQLMCALVPTLLTAGLLAGIGVAVLSQKGERGHYETVWLSALLAPFGTLVRWKLSALNGKLKGYGKWFPLGTFFANQLASIVSIIIAALLFRYENELFLDPHAHTSIAYVLEAIKTGFAGSLSTVSTFVVEGDKLQNGFPHHAKGYYYMIGSLTVSCVLCLILYSPIVRTA